MTSEKGIRSQGELEATDSAAPPRIGGLDFLRGIAILLVLVRHQNSFKFFNSIGWFGVDLFFVLSGYLVSSLLFSEANRFGKVDPFRFLVRRGFKIYPTYYLVYCGHFSFAIATKGTPRWLGVFGELTFTQNYISGWGYLFPPGWSLAVEEHFYLLLAVAFWFAAKRRWLPNPSQTYSWPSRQEWIFPTLLSLCLLGRVLYPGPFFEFRLTMTHLRLDSLLSGVWIAYLINYHRIVTKNFVSAHWRSLSLFALACVSWIPFLDILSSTFAQTIGLSLSYVSAAIAVLVITLVDDAYPSLERLFSARLVRLTSRVGIGSYAIYLVHSLVKSLVGIFCISISPGPLDSLLEFGTTFLASIGVGLFITDTFEAHCLRVRDRLYPRFIAKLVQT